MACLAESIWPNYIDIPGRGELQLSHAVLDLNGTLADGGQLLPDLGPLPFRVSTLLPCIILRVDSFGSVPNALQAVPVHVVKTGKDKTQFCRTNGRRRRGGRKRLE